MMHSYMIMKNKTAFVAIVLILVVMDDALVL